MTYSLKLSGGDLVPSGSQLAIVTGIDKLHQDIEIWLLFQFGANQMHPAFGSVLESYIGGIIDSGTQARVYNEILRTLRNYSAQQKALFDANPQLFSLAELLVSVDSVNVALGYDTVTATVQVSNPSSATAVTVSPSV